MPRYLLYGSNSHADFRREELESLAALHGIHVDLSHHATESPFLVVELADDSEAATLVGRSILLRGAYALLGEGTDYDDIQADLRSHPRYPFREYLDSSFKFTFEAFEATRSAQEQRNAIESFTHLGWRGKIEMRDPDNTFTIFEEWRKRSSATEAPELLRVFLARLVGTTSRHLIARYDLKKRGYLGTTSMESELSLVSANQVLASPGKLIYDPFVGTGSFLVACAALGATVLGSDIDGRQIKGSARNRGNIASNFRQYDLAALLLDCVVFDVKHAPWHTNFRVDGILCDPPYGVRAGAKTLGRAEGTRLSGRTGPSTLPSGEYVHLKDDYIPPKKPYELADLADDLLDYAAGLLAPAGRLAFWLPTVNEDYSPVDLPARSDMRLLSCSTQDFGRWSRRLLTYERVANGTDGQPGRRLERVRTPGHTEFRWKYYSRFGNGREVTPAAAEKLSAKDRQYVKVGTAAAASAAAV